MPSVVHAPLMNSVGFMLKEKSGEPVVSAFTAVNGRTSPPSPPRSTGVNGMTADTIYVRPHAPNTPEQTQDQKASLPRRDEWKPAPRVPENGVQNGDYSVSPSLSDRDRSPASPGKRKRSSSVEDDRSSHSPGGASVTARRRLDSYASVGRDDSPNTVSQAHGMAMEHSQQRPFPPMDRAEHDRNWPPRESQDMAHGAYSDAHHRDQRGMDTSQDGSQMGAADSQNGMERSSTTEITRAGVQVDPKKRKRQFANRTKTGCGTCRRRKKKCDELKPECNNCIRGGFICEGYANKIPWPKNGPTKPHPPLQAKERFPTEPAQLYHNHGTNREGYPDPNALSAGEGARGRPIVVEEHGHQSSRNGWGSGWPEPPRASYPPEHHPPTEYSHPPASSTHGRPPSNDHHAQHPTPGPPSQRQHNPRIYHHTPQTMSQVVNNPPAVTAEAALHHQSQQPHQQQHQQQPIHQTHAPAGPTGPPPPHYAPHPPPRPQKTEKEKMLSGEPFLPYHPQLVEERERCKGGLYRFNNTSNSAVEIAPDERLRHFRSILAARWIHQFRGPDAPMAGHLGSEVFVDTPFMCDYGYNISIGDRVAIGTQCKFLDSGRITIGRNTKIGANVTIDTERVPNDFKSLKGSRGSIVAAEVHIGENVYIGANVTIYAGVKIGTGAIIHPGSVVVRDVPRDVVARGNPAEVRHVHWPED